MEDDFYGRNDESELKRKNSKNDEMKTTKCERKVINTATANNNN